ncbi:MAG TPA: bifunctional phosphoribosylaminoimidazolecarboxamide formyltransferase/IMP cyclohydrolase [Thermoplasmataceae archaeon]|nr:bifunctional phosphoribosylaminoimidazolecarboxamide formyltransferase/IMP cyclohydrolase [Thermoplasmataceae archaeon]
MNILASVTDKTDLVSFLKVIESKIDLLYATPGTCSFLNEKGLKCRNISELTGFDDILNGRVKTLHPAVFAGILSLKDTNDPRMKLPEGMVFFDMVICNLYPFSKAAETGSLDEMIENIDIGGVSLLRAAAKNFNYVIAVSDPSDYPKIAEELVQTGKISVETRKRQALKTFARISAYDIDIYQRLNRVLMEAVPKAFFLKAFNGRELRYGENPDQKGYIYSDGSENGIANARQLQGKELSYNNLLDADSALETVMEFSEPTAVVVKHNTPCGVASHPNIEEAISRAISADAESSYGSVIAINREFTKEAYEPISKLFVEVLIAPSYTSDAMELLKKKKNMRVITAKLVPDPSLRVRSISNGVLVQTPLNSQFEKLDLKTESSASPSEIRDLEFAWKVVAHCRSNAIVLAKDLTTTGIGAGQTSRIEAVRIAVARAGPKARGSVMASDAFFPFYDNIEMAGSAGISAIVQPGGSIRDNECIQKANELGIPMYFTSKRVFLH